MTAFFPVLYSPQYEAFEKIYEHYFDNHSLYRDAFGVASLRHDIKLYKERITKSVDAKSVFNHIFGRKIFLLRRILIKIREQRRTLSKNKNHFVGITTIFQSSDFI